MKNAGMAGAVALVGVGLITIGLGNFVKAPQAMAAPVAAIVSEGPEQPGIVWYGLVQNPRVTGGNGYCTACSISTEYSILARAWSDGIVEVKKLCSGNSCSGGVDSGEWIVVASPTEGLNAASDINFDEQVNAADLGLLLADWGKAPRSPIPASDCPLGLMQ